MFHDVVEFSSRIVLNAKRNLGTAYMLAKEKRKATILDVAKHAGVSKSAVSKVLTNAYGVSPELRGKVQRSVLALNYRPNLGARSLRGSTYTLGVILPDVGNPIFTKFLTGLNAAVEDTRYSIVVGVSQLSERIERRVVDTLLDRKVDGIVYVAKRAFNDELERLAQAIPMVVLGHHSPEARNYDTVNTDDRLGAEMIVGHLVRSGRRNIAMMSIAVEPEGKLSVAYERERGYESAMRKHGLADRIRIVRSGVHFVAYEASARDMLSDDGRPDAIFCWADPAALAVISAVGRMGMQVGRDIAVAGFDNVELGAYFQNSLTSIEQNPEWMGKKAGLLLLDRIGGRVRSIHVLNDPVLVARSSSGTRPIG